MKTTALIPIMTALFLFALSNTTFAYAISGGSSITPTPSIPANPTINLNWNDVFNNLSSPFQNFSHSLQSAANTPISDFSFSTSSIPENISAGAQNLWDRFDAWLFGIIGFHVSSFFGFMLQILEWMLGLVKAAIGWLPSLFH
jgi:hypothetical protein